MLKNISNEQANAVRFHSLMKSARSPHNVGFDYLAVDKLVLDALLHGHFEKLFHGQERRGGHTLIMIQF